MRRHKGKAKRLTGLLLAALLVLTMAPVDTLMMTAYAMENESTYGGGV